MSTRAFASALLWLACAAGAYARDPEPAPAIAVEGHAIVYRGGIDAPSVARVRALLESEQGIRELAIESQGGDIAAGLDLGELVQRHGLDVRATGSACWSSCANYVFVAGRHRSIDPGTVVVWHGSAIQAGLADGVNVSSIEAGLGRPLNRWEKRRIERMAHMYVRDMQRRQARFYRSMGVDERITVFGQDVGCACEWTLPVEDMAAFGLAPVRAPEDYGLRPPGESERWRLLRLRDYPEYPINTKLSKK